MSNVSPIKKSQSDQDLITSFGDVFRELLHRNRLNQFKLSQKLDISQSYISKIEHGKRELTEPMAKLFSKQLGGSYETWLDIHQQTKEGSEQSLDSFVDILIPRKDRSQYRNTLGRHLGRDDLIDCFTREPKEKTKNKYGEEVECEIEGFNPDCVNGLSYDTPLGGYAKEKDSNGEWEWEKVQEDLIIPPGSRYMLRAKGHVQLPERLEARLHPHSNIIGELDIRLGPVIKPGWGGYLTAIGHNPYQNPVSIKVDEPIFTIEFLVAESQGIRNKPSLST